MPSLLIIAAALATTTPKADQPAFEPLSETGAQAPSCTADGAVCVSGSREGAFAVTLHGQPLAQWQATDADERASFRVLPRLLRLRGGTGLLVEVGLRRTRMYSGGNAEVVSRRLMLIRPGQKPVAVLEAPYSSDIAIRACFDDKDAQRRRGACHDEYSLESDLKVGAGTSGGLPDLQLAVLATSFPRGVSRSSDSLAMAPLGEDDLIEVTDPTCSYVRNYRFDAAAGRYVPDAPLPACTDFTAP
ncbi:hypothetical protein HT136_13085 [Novosphingobium profundi]|uniref:hypothetical protein n=1 Tax=Novosphingobium profundi TaxID=1774954 RepID=UPI001BD9E1A1|nr:hypothetical protein [Novosphingobium profundi]MBT0669299.1 hypothetical protein [Novosphingobium profundi]